MQCEQNDQTIAEENPEAKNEAEEEEEENVSMSTQEFQNEEVQMQKK